ncbi:MAG: hypothetical protein JXP73_18605 [Deltaproteobacteria bacterium]|nr:hypothetical protein [Deltaproteobacteria bacterium]
MIGHLLHPRRGTVLRSVAVLLLCAGGVALLGRSINPDYPLRDWLTWRLLALWACCLYFDAACLCFGHVVVTRWLRLTDLPAVERFVVSMAVGVVSFALAMYVAGGLALFRPWLAVLLPLLMIAIGASSFDVYFLRARNRQIPVLPSRLTSRLLVAAVLLFGSLCVFVLYLQCLTPGSLNYDSRWCHLTISQDYAREGRIVPFFADYNKAIPPLTSLLHTWAWLVPGLDLPLRSMLVLHNEFCIVLWTLAGIVAGAAWMLERAQVKGAWVAFFLFPILFIYDSNIGGSADHVLGFFAPVLFLAGMRAGRDFAPRRCALLGVLAGGAVLTKYQAITMLAPLGALLGARWLYLVARARRLCHWRGLLIFGLVAGVVVFPQFLRNWIFYRNPLYPYASEFFPGARPKLPDTPLLMRYIFLGDPDIPRGSIFKRLDKAIHVAWRSSFRRPFESGSLFVVLLPLLPFLARQRRLWWGAAVGAGALLTWGMTYPIERNAQAFIPMLAAVAAAIVVRAWQLGHLARVGLVALLGLQIIWGGDILVNQSFGGIDETLAFLRKGGEGHAKSRFDKYLATQRALDKKLPKDAVVLFHNTRLALGLDRRVLQDLPGHQALIDYRAVTTPRQLVELLRSLGVTHVVHEPGVWPALSKQEEAMFASLIERFAANVFREGEYEVFELPATLPPVEAPYRILSLGCPGYPDGVYRADAMNAFDPMPDGVRHHGPPEITTTMEEAATPEIIDRVNVVFVPARAVLPEALAAALRSRFTPAVVYGDRFTVYVRRDSPSP